MIKHKRASAAAAVAAIGVAASVFALTGAQASSGKTQILRFFDKPVAITLTESDGKVTRRPPYPKPSPVTFSTSTHSITPAITSATPRIGA
jgi:hypothetical protein